MVFKIILASFALGILAFIAYRFGVFHNASLPTPNTFFTNIPRVSPTVIPEASSSSDLLDSTTSARILLLDAPRVASINESLTFSWLVDTEASGSTSHTAIHFGKISKPHAKIPSDYPEKSAILKGAIPATFSATIKVDKEGTYYYRAHAIVNENNIWSDEKTFRVEQATLSSRPL